MFILHQCLWNDYVKITIFQNIQSEPIDPPLELPPLLARSQKTHVPHIIKIKIIAIAKVIVTAAGNYLMLTICRPCPKYRLHVKTPEICTESLEVDVTDHGGTASRKS